MLGVSSNRLRWWTRQLGEWSPAARASAPNFVPAVVTGASSSAAPVAIVRGRAGESVEVFDTAALAQWAAAVVRELSES